MQIFVADLHGHVISVEAESSDTIKHIKSKINKQFLEKYHDDIKPGFQCLVHYGTGLRVERTLSDYEIEEGYVLHMLRRPRVLPDTHFT